MKVASILLRLAGVFCLICAGLFLLELVETAQHARANMDRVTTAAVEVADQARLLRRDADRQLTGARKDLRAIADKTDKPLADLGAAITKVAGVRDDVGARLAQLDPMLADAAAISARIHETSDTLLDCRGHGACLPAQTLALVGSARYTFGQVARATPGVLASFQGIEGSAQRSSLVFEKGFPGMVRNTSIVTENVARITKPHWYDQVFKGIGVGAVVGAAVK